MGERKMKRKLRQRPTMKKPNMTFETIRISSRMVFISEGSAIVAPARSSLKIMATGLNHQRFWGLEQCVIPLFMVSIWPYLGGGFALVIVTFTEVPQANLVEVVDAETPRDGIHENRIAGRGGRKYIGDVDFEEIAGSEDRLIACIPDFHLEMSLVALSFLHPGRLTKIRKITDSK